MSLFHTYDRVLRCLAAEEAAVVLRVCRDRLPLFRELEPDIKARILAHAQLDVIDAYQAAYRARYTYLGRVLARISELVH